MFTFTKIKAAYRIGELENELTRLDQMRRRCSDRERLLGIRARYIEEQILMEDRRLERAR